MTYTIIHIHVHTPTRELCKGGLLLSDLKKKYCETGSNYSPKQEIAIQEKLHEAGPFETFLAPSVFSETPNFTKFSEPSGFAQ